jgi:hypothetical protein
VTLCLLVLATFTFNLLHVQEVSLDQILDAAF